MPVLVVVDPRCTCAEFLGPWQARFLRYIRESAVAVVVKKVALAVGGYEKIVVAVIVVVAHSHAHAKHLHLQSRLVGYVRERAVLIIVIELRRGVFLNVAGPVHAVHEKNVRPSVIVVVDEGHTRSHRFGEKFLSESAIVVDAAEPGLLRDVPELDGWGFRRCSDSCLSDDKYCQRKN